jgi:uncharacterized LabA/DUF88 family protein
MVGNFFGVTMLRRVAVFIDYQNMVATARENFPRVALVRPWTNINPVRLGELLVARRVHEPSELVQVRVYRGRPSPTRQPTLAAVNDAQASEWTRDARVTVVRKMLRYPKGSPFQPPQEKGIDVALAVDFVSLAHRRAFDVGVIASHDTDLIPAFEAVRDLRLAHVESAAWRSRNRLHIPGTSLPWCHVLDEPDFQAVHDTRDYIKP